MSKVINKNKIFNTMKRSYLKEVLILKWSFYSIDPARVKFTCYDICVICRLVWYSLMRDDCVGRVIRSTIIVCSRSPTFWSPRYFECDFCFSSNIVLSLVFAIPLLATVGVLRRETTPSTSWRESIRNAGARGIRQLYSGTNSDDFRTYVFKLLFSS